MPACVHTDAVDQVDKGKDYCEACKEMGDDWVHLRTCQACGVTLCCNSSKNQHAKKHFEASGHPVIASAEKNDYWMWCYVHEAYDRYA